jgi:hypothetical protein
MPVRIERFIIAPVVAAQYRVDHDQRSIVQRAGAVVPKDHWERDPLRVCCDPAQREDVVPIQVGVRYLDSEPALGHLRFRESPAARAANRNKSQNLFKTCE